MSRIARADGPVRDLGSVRQDQQHSPAVPSARAAAPLAAEWNPAAPQTPGPMASPPVPQDRIPCRTPQRPARDRLKDALADQDKTSQTRGFEAPPASHPPDESCLGTDTNIRPTCRHILRSL